MRRSLALPCLLMLGVTGMYAIGQDTDKADQFGPSTFPGDLTEPSGDIAFEEEATLDAVAEGVQSDVDALRSQYLQRVEEKARLMDKAELREAISQMERDIDELKASAKLVEARQALLSLVEEHPDTEAATIARHMLESTSIRLPGSPEQGNPAPFNLDAF